MNPYSYLHFRRQLARAGLHQFVASLGGTMEIIVLAFSPVLLGLLACIALPGLLAPSLPWPQAGGLLAAQTLLIATPTWLLRQRLHPADIALWSLALPIPPRQRWQAEAAVAGMLIAPMALAYAASIVVWLYQNPVWLQPVKWRGLSATLLSLLLGWAIATVLLMQRGQAPLRQGRAPAAPPGAMAAIPYTARQPGSLFVTSWYYWRLLFWLPCWRPRGESASIGLQQSMLLAGALLCVSAWLWQAPWVPAALWGAGASLLLMLLTDRGDKAVSRQIALLRPVTAAWPQPMAPLFRRAIVLTLAPAALVMAWFALLVLTTGRSSSSPTVAMAWLGCAALAQLAIVGLRQLSVRARVGLVMGASVLLTAIGSELWN
ncbi:MAG: hypothetical protein ABW202_22000 [Duganella sp.]